MAGAPWILALLAPGLLLAQAPPLRLPPPPPPPGVGAALTRAPASGEQASTNGEQGQRGRLLVINGQEQRAQWQWIGSDARRPRELWLPLEVLQNQLGVSSRTSPGGTLELEWYGTTLRVPARAQRSLDDEVAVEALELLHAAGITAERQGQRLVLGRPAVNLLQVRSGSGGQRVVLDLDGPALVRDGEATLLITARARPDQLSVLQALGLKASPDAAGLQLQVAARRPSRVFTLGEPARVVLDLPPPAGIGADGPAPGLDPRLEALLGRELRWERLIRNGIRINAVQLDPRTSSLQLRPLASDSGMEGLGPLTQLAGRQGALVAVNGGYFNRVRRLPLGALRVDGRWLSGPILNRGVVAWERGNLPRFGRLRLEEWVQGPDGQRLPLVVLNSGYVQRGVSRYNADWGPVYRALSGGETALRLQGGQVVEQLAAPDLERGVALAAGDELLVARGGMLLPWPPGTALTVTSRPSDTLGSAPFVVGGGPLLLQEGRVVMNGSAEGFGAAFLSQGAPRTVVASDGNRLWLVTLEGTEDAGPTLGETAAVLQQMGLREALNLDGGSSTGLVMGGTMPVKGRGVVGTVHHGIGLVP
jgi:hypothetical protein